MKKALLTYLFATAGVLPALANAITLDGISFTPGATLVIGTFYQGEVNESGYTRGIGAVGQILGGV